MASAVDARPDVMLLAADWRERAMLRAQLLEDGYDVVAIDAWPSRLSRAPGTTPQLLIVDLHGLPKPDVVLDEVRGLVPAERVLVIAGIGTVSSERIAQLGYRMVKRPVRLGDLTEIVATILQRRHPPRG